MLRKMKTKKPKFLKLILASQSPRRREILTDAGFKFDVYPSNSSESFDENLTFEENLCAVAEGKVEAISDKITKRFKKGFLILSADTTVVLEGKVLNKPKDRRDAVRMLKFLSGKIHTVCTAYSLYNHDEGLGVTKIVQTRVGFKKLERSIIEDYLDSGEAFDKAGAYGIQGLARAFINLVDGDLLNVIGLPITDVRDELRKRKWNVQTSRRPKKNKRSGSPRR